MPTATIVSTVSLSSRSKWGAPPYCGAEDTGSACAARGGEPLRNRPLDDG